MTPRLYENYANEIAQTLDMISWYELHAMVHILHSARLEGKQIFVFGNGGSAATASHMACDLNKNTVAPHVPRFKVMACTDNVASLTAYGNDDGYASVFSEQMQNFLQAGDIVIAISTSGNSPNVLNAIELAKEMGAFTIGWTGYEGGKLAKLVDMSINVPNHCVEQIEDIHMIFEHMITVALRQAAKAENSASVALDMPLMRQPAA
jgi:D-sedoheptulose 7-phosphate isomerase